jgi:hypothetical protein
MFNIFGKSTPPAPPAPSRLQKSWEQFDRKLTADPDMFLNKNTQRPNLNRPELLTVRQPGRSLTQKFSQQNLKLGKNVFADINKLRKAQEVEKNYKNLQFDQDAFKQRARPIKDDAEFNLFRDDLNHTRDQYDKTIEEIKELENYASECATKVAENARKLPDLYARRDYYLTKNSWVKGTKPTGILLSKNAALGNYDRMRREIEKGNLNPSKAPKSFLSHIGFSNEKNIRKMLDPLSVNELNNVFSKLDLSDPSRQLVQRIIQQRKLQATQNYNKYTEDLLNVPTGPTTEKSVNDLKALYFTNPKFKFDFLKMEQDERKLSVKREREKYLKLKLMEQLALIDEDLDLTSRQKLERKTALRILFSNNKSEFKKLYARRLIDNTAEPAQTLGFIRDAQQEQLNQAKRTRVREDYLKRIAYQRAYNERSVAKLARKRQLENRAKREVRSIYR